MPLIVSDHLLEFFFGESADNGLLALDAADFLRQQLVGIVFLEGISEEDFERLEKIIDIIRRATCFEHVVEKFLDMTRQNFFDGSDAVLSFQKAEEIVDLLSVIPDGTRGEFAGLAMEDKLVTDGRKQHKRGRLITRRLLFYTKKALRLYKPECRR